MSNFIHAYCRAWKTLKSISLAFCLCAVLLCQPAGAAGALLIIDYPDYWPFFTRMDDGKMTGFFHDIVTEALSRMGMTARWREYPWGRCQAHVRTGETEAIITVPTAQRLKYTKTHEDPFYFKQLKVFTYAGHPQLDYIRGMQSIADIKAANFTVITYTGNGWNDKNIRARGIKAYETPKLENVWRMLASKRGDIVIEWPGAAWAAIRKVKVMGRVVQTNVALQSMPFHLLISKDSAQTAILPEFNQKILDMKEEGLIEKMVEKYIQSPAPAK